MNVVYETNGKGFLGWIVELPGAYVRGVTIEEARSKIAGEIIDYGKWLGIKVVAGDSCGESIKSCDLHVEDADSDITLDSELTDYGNLRDFEYWCGLALVSGIKSADVYRHCVYKDFVDRSKVRETFYGAAYSTINAQFAHIVDVQNYYLAQIGTKIDTSGGLEESRGAFVGQLKQKYFSEGNRLYHYDEEDWTIRKIIRRIIWHDRIHTRAIGRMEQKAEQFCAESGTKNEQEHSL